MTAARTQEQIINDSIDAVIGREGGESDLAIDRGGPTNFGITQRTLDEAVRREVVYVKKVKDLTRAAARLVYRSLFIDQPRLAVIRDPDLFDLVVDSAVNMGPQRVIRWIQNSLGIAEDGILGPVTQEALQTAEERGRGHQVYRDVLAESIVHLGRLITNDVRDEDHDGRTDAAQLAAGWFNRRAEFIRRTP